MLPLLITIDFKKGLFLSIIIFAIVYTSGDAELFKVGIPVGKIKYNSQTLNDNVEFFSAFSQLKFVKVRSFKKLD